MTDSLLRSFEERVAELSGIEPPQSHRAHFRRELEKAFKKQAITAEEFLRRLSADAEARQLLLNAATINETYFFREEKQFALLQDKLFEELFAKKGFVRIWSVSCSTGEEAISLAVLAQQAASRSASRSFEIWATDINTEVLGQLREGRYASPSFRRDGARFHPLLAAMGGKDAASAGAAFVLPQELAGRLRVRPFNLFLDNTDFLPGPVDLLFIRNTLLYMPPENRSVALAKLAGTLSDGGLLFLGASEVPFMEHQDLTLVEDGAIYFFAKADGAQKKKLANVLAEKLAPGSRPASTEQRPAAAGAAPTPIGQPESWPPPAALAALEAINCGNAAAARRSVKSLKTAHPAIAAYLEARIHEAETAGSHRTKHGAVVAGTSRDLYSAALDQQADLWPALFWRAIAAGESNQRAAKKDFEACARLLEQESSKRWEWLTDGFSSQYFRDMCSKWLTKLDSTAGKGAGSGDQPRSLYRQLS